MRDTLRYFRHRESIFCFLPLLPPDTSRAALLLIIFIIYPRNKAKTIRRQVSLLCNARLLLEDTLECRKKERSYSVPPLFRLCSVVILLADSHTFSLFSVSRLPSRTRVNPFTFCSAGDATERAAGGGSDCKAPPAASIRNLDQARTKGRVPRGRKKALRRRREKNARLAKGYSEKESASEVAIAAGFLPFFLANVDCVSRARGTKPTKVLTPSDQKKRGEFIFCVNAGQRFRSATNQRNGDFEAPATARPRVKVPSLRVMWT